MLESSFTRRLSCARRGAGGISIKESAVNRRKLVSVSMLCMATSLSGCYVVPMDAHYPPVPPGAALAPSTTAPAVALIAASPGVQQVRLYPLNETAGKTGA